jgi:hypothetical protein
VQHGQTPQELRTPACRWRRRDLTAAETVPSANRSRRRSDDDAKCTVAISVAAPGMRMRTKRALCFFCPQCDIPPGNEVDMTGPVDYAARKPQLGSDDASRAVWDTLLS